MACCQQWQPFVIIVQFQLEWGDHDVGIPIGDHWLLLDCLCLLFSFSELGICTNNRSIGVFLEEMEIKEDMEEWKGFPIKGFKLNLLDFHRFIIQIN
jgi:hypothetical protein